MKFKRTLLLLALVPLLGLATLAVDFARFLAAPAAPAPRTVVTVPPGSSFTAVARRLETEGVVTSARYFRLLGRLSAAGSRIRTGEYLFDAPARPQRVLERLVEGDVRRYDVTIPEGWSMAEVASRLESEGLGKKQALLKLGHDPAFVARLGLEGPSLEGYLFPETYRFDRGMGEERLLEAMVEEFRRRYPAELDRKAAARDLTRHQLVTLASIIQKEAGNVEEMPLISAVFHNRLQRGIPLQADPTVIYGLEDFDGNLTRRHLRQHTPYNTYRIGGLPPGPIANPGEEALLAAADPAPVDYLYFVARGDGTHVFARTLTEHNRNVRRFQLRR